MDGAADIEFGAAASANVTFDAGATETPKLVDSFDSSDRLWIRLATWILSMWRLGPAPSVNYAASQDRTGGTLTVTDGVHTANVALLG